MNKDFKAPSWCPIPQCIFDARIRGHLSTEYVNVTYKSEIDEGPGIVFWVHRNKILSDEETNKIIYVDSGDISGGYYEIDGKWIAFSLTKFIKTRNDSGNIVWHIFGRWCSVPDVISDEGELISRFEGICIP
ncbi:MAG: hypothetical protein WCS89_02070 [Candidatus Paceibacterota bacterium]|jgi:hypothetical protein